MGVSRIGAARFLIGALASIVLIMGLAGCTGAGRVVATTPPWWVPHLTLDHDLTMAGLRELRLTKSRTDSGSLRIVGEYVNESEWKLSAVFRFTWFDASGQPVESILSGWEAVHALPRTRATFAGIAPRDDIEEFHVELMAAHRLKGVPARPKHDNRP